MSETENTAGQSGVSDEQKYAPDAMQASSAQAAGNSDVNLDLVLDVPVSLALHVGATKISIRELVNLAEGSVVALDRSASEPLDVMVNGTLVAHGEIVVVDGQFGVRLTDVVSPAQRIEQLN